MREASIRIGLMVGVPDDVEGSTHTPGVVESGHAEHWMVRLNDGELTGPWSADDFARVVK